MPNFRFKNLTFIIWHQNNRNHNSTTRVCKVTRDPKVILPTPFYHIGFNIAEIINVFELDNKYHIEQDKTYLNPNTLDQPYDSGKINNANITNVYDKMYTIKCQSRLMWLK